MSQDELQSASGEADVSPGQQLRRSLLVSLLQTGPELHNFSPK